MWETMFLSNYSIKRNIANIKVNETENIVEKLEPKDRLPIYIWLMNMYGRGMCLFGWEKKDKLNCCFNCMKDCGDSVLLESMYNFIFEFEAPLPEVIKRYRETFEKRKDISSWQELQHLYVRHGMMAEADAMYRELLTERKELIVDEPEYAYRAYIDYVLLYQRDLKDALQCYVDAKAAFKDTDIEGFWELELMFLTNTFNEPERFEVILKPFVEKGLLPEEKYYRMVFIANLLNLKEKKAGELFEIISQYPIFVNPFTGMSVSFNEDIFYLCQIVSAGFPAQIEVRNNADYNETAAAVALALEKDCLVALGDTVLEDRLVDKYSQIIIRTNEIEKLFRK